MGHLAPLYDLASALESAPCAFKCAGRKSQATLFRSLGALATVFPTDFNAERIRIIDSRDAMV